MACASSRCPLSVSWHRGGKLTGSTEHTGQSRGERACCNRVDSGEVRDATNVVGGLRYLFGVVEVEERCQLWLVISVVHATWSHKTLWCIFTFACFVTIWFLHFTAAALFWLEEWLFPEFYHRIYSQVIHVGMWGSTDYVMIHFTLFCFDASTQQMIAAPFIVPSCSEWSYTNLAKAGNLPARYLTCMDIIRLLFYVAWTWAFYL